MVSALTSLTLAMVGVPGPHRATQPSVLLMRITSQVLEQKTPGKLLLCRALHPEKCSFDNNYSLIISISDTINGRSTQNTINNLKRSQLPDFVTTGFNDQGKDFYNAHLLLSNHKASSQV